MKTNDRTILHCDMNNYFAQVSLLKKPELVDMPVAIAGNPQKRHGIILAKNQIAKSFGIKTAETIYSAKAKCPSLIILPPQMQDYKRYSKLINEIYLRYTDQVEPFSIDESWLDVTNSQKLFGDGRNIADNIRKDVISELGLTLSAGVSFTKIFAKMGSELKKPNATTVIDRYNFKNILWPMPIENMFMVGKSMTEKLIGKNIKTIGDLACADRAELESMLGKNAVSLSIYAAGEDNESVNSFINLKEAKSIGNGLTFNRDLVGIRDIKTAIRGLSDKVAARLKKGGYLASGIRVEIKTPSFQSFSKQTQITDPTNLAETLYLEGIKLIFSFRNPKDSIRMITFTAINLHSDKLPVQINIDEFLSSDISDKDKSKEAAISSIRKRFGDSSITYGSILDNDLGITLEHHLEFDD